MTHADPRLLLTYRGLKASLAPRRTLRARLSELFARANEADRDFRDLTEPGDMPDA